MKKIFTLFFACMLSIVASAQIWWGYAPDDAAKGTIGTGKANTFHQAIFIPGDHGVAGGKTIKAVRFALTAPNAKDAKVWIASKLPTTVNANQTLQLVDVPAEKLGSDNIEVELPEAYAIPAEGVYVGYSFTIRQVSTNADGYPIYVSGTDALNTLLVKIGSDAWQDYNGSGLGNLFLQVLLEGTFGNDMVTPASFGPVYVGLNDSNTAEVSLLNAGMNDVTSISYTVTNDGVAGAEKQVTLTSPIAFNSTGTVSIDIPANAAPGEKVEKFTVTRVNGNANNATNATSQFTLITLNKYIERNVVVEEFTGTGCGYCPRGLVGMDNLRKTFGDRFIGIGIHQYNNTDAMYISSYPNLGFSGAPECIIDRKGKMDPYYGQGNDIRDDFRAEMAIPATAQVSVAGLMDPELTQVTATAEVEALFDNSNYTIEFVVVADGLKGTGSGWNQANYYANYNAKQLPEDLAIFGSGEKFGKNPFSGWTFNDVALVSSYVGGKNQVPAIGTLNGGERKSVSYTLQMPTSGTLLNALKEDEVYIVAMVIDDQNGQIVNAAKQKVSIGQTQAAGYAFADKDGNEITTAEITCNQVEDDGFGDLEVASGLFLKNVGGEEGTKVTMQANITRMDNGSVKLCFPINCVSYDATGEQSETPAATIPLGTWQNVLTEWCPTAYGECEVVYTARVYKGLAELGSFAVTVNYVNADVTGVASTKNDNAHQHETFDLSGRRTVNERRGLSIVRMSDGSVRKVLR